MSKTMMNLVGETDARVWAREFVRLAKLHPNIPTDEGTMIGWFANAIMAGHDGHPAEQQRRREAIERALGEPVPEPEPAELLDARHDGPDPTGPLMGTEPERTDAWKPAKGAVPSGDQRAEDVIRRSRDESEPVSEPEQDRIISASEHVKKCSAYLRDHPESPEAEALRQEAMDYHLNHGYNGDPDRPAAEGGWLGSEPEQ